MKILTPSAQMATVMKDKKIVAARRQTQNLKSILFKPRFDTTVHMSKGSVLPCKKDKNRGSQRGRLIMHSGFKRKKFVARCQECQMETSAANLNNS